MNLFIISIVFAIYLLEITSFYLIYKNQNFQFNQNKKIAKKLSLPFDERSQKEVYNDLNKEFKKYIQLILEFLLSIIKK